MSSGRPKASVLPEPVLALPQTSRPAMASGMVMAWTGKGALMPWEERTATSSGATMGSLPSIRTTNSSPPILPMVSAPRKVLERRAATATNRRSPVSCPRESLTILKSSMSM